MYEIVNENEINILYTDIRNLIEQSKNRIYKTVNTEMINLYWNIGKMIVERQDRQIRAKYGDNLIENISEN